MRSTVTGKPPVNPDDAPVPNDAKRPDGQHVDHWVLSPEERARGFVRPVRNCYTHVGPPGPQNPLRDLTPHEREVYDPEYAKYEEYPPLVQAEGKLGRFWTQAQLDAIGQGCGRTTLMPRAIAETYAVNPGYYGSTFCSGCQKYLAVGERGEFVWEGTQERVGT